MRGLPAAPLFAATALVASAVATQAIAHERAVAATAGIPLWLIVVLATCVALAAILAVRQIRLARALARAARQLDAHGVNPAAPLATAGVPKDVRPLLDQVNALHARMVSVLDAERRFTAAAAHEMRTPLAAVRVQAQVAEHARTQQATREALAQLQVCVERAAHTIDQLLLLAQIDDARFRGSIAGTVQLAEVAASVVDALAPVLRSRDIDLTLHLEPVAVQGLEHGLAAVVRNLVENAARHSPPKSRVRVASGAAGAEAFLTVDDSGPGIPLHERERVFERFYRLPTPDADGLGVGLSIVQSVVRAHGGRVVLADSEFGGLKATLYLSRVAA